MVLFKIEAFKTEWPCLSNIYTSVILKLDFEKAFDKVEHEVILQVLTHKGFPR
jgi:hypothetical protein